MAITYFPFDAGAGANVTEDQWRKMAQHWRATGVLGGEDDELAVTESAPNAMTVDVAAGKAWIRGHYMESDDVEVKTLSASDLTNPRIDRIVCRVDFGNNTITIAVLEGTPAASPAVPALTQSASTWEISLAQIAVAAAVSSITDADITDERTFTPDGTPVGTVLDYAGATAPSGYLLCDGTAVSRTVYSALFREVGEAYGVGDGSTTFNLPDTRGRMAVGKGTHADVDALGDSDGIAVGNRRPKHKHTVSSPNTFLVAGGSGQPTGSAAANWSTAAESQTVGPQTGAEPTDSPAYVVFNKIIKT